MTAVVPGQTSTGPLARANSDCLRANAHRLRRDLRAALLSGAGVGILPIASFRPSIPSPWRLGAAALYLSARGRQRATDLHARREGIARKTTAGKRLQALGGNGPFAAGVGDTRGGDRVGAATAGRSDAHGSGIAGQARGDDSATRAGHRRACPRLHVPDSPRTIGLGACRAGAVFVEAREVDGAPGCGIGWRRLGAGGRRALTLTDAALVAGSRSESRSLSRTAVTIPISHAD